jgi:integrase
MATLLYGSGLRLLECLRLRIKEIDFEKREILVRGGKGNKDRVTVLPETARDPLRLHIEGVRQQYEADLAQDFGGTTLPDGIARKYPTAGREWPWQYVFPASRTVFDQRTGRRLRHHLDESVLQRAVKEAVARSRISKTASCHTLRHSCRDTPFIERVRHPDRAGAAWPSGRQHDDDLHARSQPRRSRCPQPGRWTVRLNWGDLQNYLAKRSGCTARFIRAR